MIRTVQFVGLLATVIFLLDSGTSAGASGSGALYSTRADTDYDTSNNAQAPADSLSAKQPSNSEASHASRRTSSLIVSLFQTRPSNFDHTFGKFSEDERSEMLTLAKNTFQFAYDNYVQYAFPMDELNPIQCKGRGPDLIDRQVQFFFLGSLFFASILCTYYCTE